MWAGGGQSAARRTGRRVTTNTSCRGQEEMPGPGAQSQVSNTLHKLTMSALLGDSGVKTNTQWAPVSLCSAPRVPLHPRRSPRQHFLSCLPSLNNTEVFHSPTKGHLLGREMRRGYLMATSSFMGRGQVLKLDKSGGCPTVNIAEPYAL